MEVLHMRRIKLLAAAFSFSTISFANPCNSLVCVPQLDGGLVIGVTGGYFQPSAENNELYYAQDLYQSLSDSTNFFNSKHNSLSPGYTWGWGGNLGYIFSGTGNDISVNYFYLSTSDASSTNAIPSNFIIPVGLFNVASASASFAVDYKLNQVDLTVGQSIYVGGLGSIHPMVGLRWAELEKNLTGTYYPIDQNTRQITASLPASYESTFHGLGPIVGVDASYTFVNTVFDIVAHADSALLLGDIKNQFIESLNIYQPSSSTIIENSSITKNRMVPVVDAKLGARYRYAFPNKTNANLALEVGYQFSEYFDALDSVKYAYLSVSNVTSAFSYQGPYATLTLQL
jgi:hypothetical protein